MYVCMHVCMHACMHACMYVCMYVMYVMYVIVVRLREDRRTPLHSWRSQMCREMIRILAAPARILREPCRFMLESWPQNATAFASFNAKEFKKKGAKMIPKATKSTKMSQNGARAKKIAPRIGKEPKKDQRGNTFEPPLGTPNQPKSKKKGSRKSMIVSTPSWNRLCLILGSLRHPKSSQNEVKIDPRAGQTDYRPDCIFCRPCQ